MNTIFSVVPYIHIREPTSGDSIKSPYQGSGPRQMSNINCGEQQQQQQHEDKLH